MKTMKTPMTIPAPRRQRGVSVITVVVAIAIIVGIAAAAWFLIVRPHHAAMEAQKPVVQVHKHAPSKAPSPVDVASMSTSQLLSEASKAIKDQRFLAPKGNNAFEFYLKVLDRQPDNQVAKDALRETFPFAANAAEQVINQGNFAEAEREIALLAKAAPDNYTLTILRSKLDARRRVRVARQQQAQQEAAQQQAAAAAAAQAKQETLAEQQQAAKQAAAQAQQAAAAKAAAAKRAAQQRKAELAKQQPASPPAPKVVIQGAVLVKQVRAQYPPAANRQRRQGWVVVQYTVGKDGKVHDAHVIASQPAHVFDRAAIRAISRYEYKPALRNGKPMAVTMTKRFNFTLGNS